MFELPFQNVLKMGPLSQVMSMIPGIEANMIPKGKEKEGVAQLKRFITMMDSMTNEGSRWSLRIILDKSLIENHLNNH